eukprot:TRINITY_DN10442_c0_g1_i2.p1 TRINITY_DN10442_c0_g1~~TRINITY_DN10442_c0_g1_i2.p1  ORF type:complete len:493 (+),score=36.26 TRINITY_DN10442_c0_g1_i2:108-1481(+)
MLGWDPRGGVVIPGVSEFLAPTWTAPAAAAATAVAGGAAAAPLPSAAATPAVLVTPPSAGTVAATGSGSGMLGTLVSTLGWAVRLLGGWVVVDELRRYFLPDQAQGPSILQRVLGALKRAGVWVGLLNEDPPQQIRDAAEEAIARQAEGQGAVRASWEYTLSLVQRVMGYTPPVPPPAQISPRHRDAVDREPAWGTDAWQRALARSSPAVSAATPPAQDSSVGAPQQSPHRIKRPGSPGFVRDHAAHIDAVERGASAEATAGASHGYSWPGSAPLREGRRGGSCCTAPCRLRRPTRAPRPRPPTPPGGRRPPAGCPTQPRLTRTTPTSPRPAPPGRRASRALSGRRASPLTPRGRRGHPPACAVAGRCGRWYRSAARPAPVRGARARCATALSEAPLPPAAASGAPPCRPRRRAPGSEGAGKRGGGGAAASLPCRGTPSVRTRRGKGESLYTAPPFT